MIMMKSGSGVCVMYDTCMCEYVCVCVCVWICVRERESERASERASEQQRVREREYLHIDIRVIKSSHTHMRVHTYIYSYTRIYIQGHPADGNEIRPPALFPAQGINVYRS